MKAAAINHEKKRFDVRYNRLSNIQTYGENNDYPQSVMDIVEGSYSGSACLSRYIDFVGGNGFADPDNYQIVVNTDGETADKLLMKIVEDYCTFGGFSLHLNRNLLGQITEIRHIPYEMVRLGADNTKKSGMVAIHPDWGRRTHKSFNETPIEYIDLYNPDAEDLRARIIAAGGVSKYKGQVYYYSNRGEGNYPLPIFDSVLTDMNTQEAISNITNRNAKRGFLPSGIVAEFDETFDPDNKEDQLRFDETTELLKSLMGDENASGLLHIMLKNKDELPELIKMETQNYDKEFTISREAVREAIGQSFMQPKEIRCEEVSGGFSNDTMEQAYKVYNAVTAGDRLVIETELTGIFKNWVYPLRCNFQISPLTYGTETILSLLGDKVDKIVELANNNEIPIVNRKAQIMVLYGLSEDQTNKILCLNANND